MTARIGRTSAPARLIFAQMAQKSPPRPVGFFFGNNGDTLVEASPVCGAAHSAKPLLNLPTWTWPNGSKTWHASAKNASHVTNLRFDPNQPMVATYFSRSLRSWMRKRIKSVRVVKPHFSRTSSQHVDESKEHSKNGWVATSLFGARGSYRAACSRCVNDDRRPVSGACETIPRPANLFSAPRRSIYLQRSGRLVRLLAGATEVRKLRAARTG
jgi:hypothetical protein